MTSPFKPDYATLLQLSQKAYDDHEEMTAFAAFPHDLKAQKFTPDLQPATDLFLSDKKLSSQVHTPLETIIKKTATSMCWREIYKVPPDTTHPEKYDFSKKFGCYSLIGNDAPFSSDLMRLFIVYMPANLIYPWHSHPAEEIYLMLSGEAIFKRQNYDDEQLGEGQTMFHQSQIAHQIETKDKPMLALVAWRNHLDTPPILLEEI